MPKALAPEISTWPDADPQLIGSRCGACEFVTFPAQDRCPNCSTAPMTEELLPRTGTIVAWTVQAFPPGAPYVGPVGKDFQPFGVGLVELDDVVRVEGRLTESDPSKIEFGQRVELTMIPFATDDAGDDIYTFAFRSVSA
ncbi:Zn-ribbon domain-containing OB-fold protein [Gordonia sp. (in: high G+C Gram-positive bacteria)]|jgi:uncharacterized OB-fold protein|uniref:Zn-ribbon domain-containing OB-fold protein n=1 Tax=Gordonia sp. (in: high G+C Gram-positive bacteria) TaxID=84139 RepID=UPI001D229D08|nr:OB-fold domain-containing protein [Gordonia sp. (in: high G+C Gram-positive bacteria)]MCB1296963.1 OB-fold domain-containing protein [Gordonia sp. (in: high G+C Gram-positive bacteria)]HMS76488.1 OB-fold domain-containing protein [Gordonia sp. (in: high G+C Gram-positive bacteria)]HQV17270.1 OB-fold domain-containing protein [Gordonia sp. (in: high G+C Gram-positive bacteria)]